MQVRPEYSAADLLGDLEQMMMVVPINTEINETEDVTQQYRQDRFQRGKFNRMRYLQFQHHDRDDDGKDTVAESFKAGCFDTFELLSQCGARARVVGRSQHAFLDIVNVEEKFHFTRRMTELRNVSLEIFLRLLG